MSLRGAIAWGAGLAVVALGIAVAMAQEGGTRVQDVFGFERARLPEEPQEGLPPLDVSCQGAELFGGSEIERSAFCASRKRAYASVRTLASQALAEDSGRFRAHFLLGVAQHRGEGNLPKALHHLEKAEAGFSAEFGDVLDEDDPSRMLGYRILHELMDVHGEMDHHEARIAYADAITERIQVEQQVSKAWPLMKLGRFDEARAVVAAALESEDAWDRSIARTSLCAIESELRRREQAYEACLAAAAPYRNEQSDGAVELTNAGAASEETLRFDEAEQLFLEATRRPPGMSVNPWGRLVHLYLSQGRLSESIGALRRMDRYREARPRAYLDQQDEAEAGIARTSLLLTAGWPLMAMEQTRKILNRPDRQGTSSAAADQNEAGAAVFARAVFRAAASMLEQEAALAPFWAGWQLRWDAIGLRLEAWWAGRKALPTLSKAERLIATLRPEVPGSLEMPGWLDPEVVQLVGSGVAEVALGRAKAQESLPPSASEPYFKAVETEIAWSRGDYDEAAEKAEAVVATAPRGFTMGAARAAALGADAARRAGRRALALELFKTAYERDPMVFRRLDLRLPLIVQAAGGADARRAAELLSGSPAFARAEWGFRLVVTDHGADFGAPDGTILTSVAVPKLDEYAPEDRARWLASGIQRRLFAPRVDVTVVGIGGLDGGVGTGARLTDRVLDMLLGRGRSQP